MFGDKCVAPGYTKIRNKLEEYGVKLLGVDCDGYIEPLIQNWLDSGVNLQFPLERGTWEARPEGSPSRVSKKRAHGVMLPDKRVTLEELVTGRKVGRTSAEQISRFIRSLALSEVSTSVGKSKQF